MFAGFIAIGCSDRTALGVGSSSEVRVLLREAEARGYVSQANALRDLTVTTGEYEEAMRNSASCLRAAGFDVSDVSGFMRGKIQDFRYAVSGLIDDNARARENQAEIECQATNLDLVRMGYKIANRALEAQLETDLANKVAACLRAQGFQVDDGLSLQVLSARVPRTTFSDCLGSAAAGH